MTLPLTLTLTLTPDLALVPGLVSSRGLPSLRVGLGKCSFLERLTTKELPCRQEGGALGARELGGEGKRVAVVGVAVVGVGVTVVGVAVVGVIVVGVTVVGGREALRWQKSSEVAEKQ